MSRSQQTQTFNTASQESATNEANAQKSEQNEQQDINQQESQLAKFSANNPYMQGGEFQSAQNKSLSNTADANAQAARAQLEQQALRTGQNPAAANATVSSLAQADERNLADQQAKANAQRISSEAGYNQQGVEDAAKIAAEQENLASLQGGQAQGELGAQEQAAQQPSFLDEFGNSLVQGGIGAGSKWATHGA